jgi:hypothetical protein
MIRFIAAALASLVLVTAAHYDYLTRHLYAYLWPYLLASSVFLGVAAWLLRARRASRLGEALLVAGSCIVALSLGYLTALAWMKGPEFLLTKMPEAVAVSLPFTLIVSGGWEIVLLTVILCAGTRYLAERADKSTA